MGLSLEDIPKPWRGAVGLAAFVAVVLAGAGAGVAGVRGIARAEALVVVTEDRDAFKKAALEAARTGANEAVRDALVPIAMELRGHVKEDDQRQRETDRRLEEVGHKK